jgi:rhamnosyltransferase
VFLLYDADGICDESVLRVVRALRPHAARFVVVANGGLIASGLSLLEAIADDVIERPNTGFDVGAYTEALRSVGWSHLAEFDELLLVNNTFFGPVGSFDPLFERMSHDNVDFWGMTNHPAVSPNPFTGRGVMPEHLQSYWLVIRKTILRDASFEKYWQSLPMPQTYNDVVVNFESQFTQYFSERGFTWVAAYRAEDYGVLNPSMEAPLALLKDGCPIFKKRLYFHDVPALASNGVLTAAVSEYAEANGFPEDVIVDGVRRRSSVRELSLGLGATFSLCVRPYGQLQQSSKVAESDCGIRYVTERPWKSIVAPAGVRGILGDARILVVLGDEAQLRNQRDGEALQWSFARSIFNDDPGRIAELFSEHDRLGGLFPIAKTLCKPVSGRSWFVRSLNASKVAEALDVSGPFNYSSIVAPYRGLGAYRADLLSEMRARISSAGGWTQLSALAGGEDELELTLDNLAGDVAKELGLFVGQIATDEELRLLMPLMQDVYSRKPFIYPDYLDYPYSGRVIQPSFKNRVGQMIKSRWPDLFDRLYSVQQSLRNRQGHLNGH